MTHENKQVTTVSIDGSRQRPLLVDIQKPKNVVYGTVLFLHGFKGFKDWGTFNHIADYFVDKGFCFIKFNFSYNGGTIDQPIDFPDENAFGENNLSTELNDLSCVIDYIDREGLIYNSLTLLGHSRGGGISILGAAEDERVSQLITLASVADFESRMPDYKAIKTWELTGVRYILNGRTKQNLPQFYQFYEDYIRHKSRLDILKATRSLIIPFLIIHGEDDETVSTKDAELLQKNCPKAVLKLIKGANHTFNGFHPYTEEELPKETLKALNESVQFLLNRINS